MGVWGTAVFSDDLAADTRDALTDLIAEGLTTEEATQRLVSESADILSDEADSTVFWLAVAATQSKLGRLMDSTRAKAVQIIDSGVDLRRWEDAGAAEINQRKKHLAKLREKLLGPQPKPRKPKRIERSSTDFEAGDVAVFHLDDRTSVRFCVVEIWGDRGGTYADICLLGLDDNKPFKKRALPLADTLGPHYTMLGHEPAATVTLLCRAVQLPDRTRETFAAWNAISIDGHACFWRDFPEALKTVLPKLGWS